MNKSVAIVFALLAAALPARSAFVTINFEDLTDGTVVGDNYAARYGVHFTDAVVETKGMSLSPLFPPADGTNVAVDLPVDPMIITFDKTTLEFSARFTWTAPLMFYIIYNNGQVENLDSITQFGPVVGTANFTGASLVGGGGNPNQVFLFGNNSGIEEVDIYTTPGLVGGDTFTIDQISLDIVPEPNEVYALGGGLMCLSAAMLRRRRPSRRTN